MKLTFLAIVALLFVQCSSNDDNSTTPTEPQTMEEQFSYEMFNNNSVNLPYREAKFNQEKTGSSALVILLHGGSSRGSDNKAQLEPQAVKNVFEYLKASNFKSILLVPQCPENRLWNEASETTPMSAIVLNLINSFTLSQNIDKTRIYMLGYSAGGSGAWRMISDNPKLFAAAMPAVATARLVVADNVIQTPVYAVAGSEDALMSAQEIQSFVDILTAKGGEVKFDILQGKDHAGACGEAFSTERLNWTFGHTRK